jgi:hypothetical protein
MKIPTLEEIELEMMQNPSPSRLAELSAKYAYATNQYEDILVRKPPIWNEMRKAFKSDTACERAWEATEAGVSERHWKFQIKKIEKMMSAAKTLIDVKTGEAQNII